MADVQLFGLDPVGAPPDERPPACRQRRTRRAALPGARASRWLPRPSRERSSESTPSGSSRWRGLPSGRTCSPGSCSSLSILAWVRHARSGRQSATTLASIVAFALGLLAKPMLVTLPAVLAAARPVAARPRAPRRGARRHADSWKEAARSPRAVRGALAPRRRRHDLHAGRDGQLRIRSRPVPGAADRQCLHVRLRVPGEDGLARGSVGLLSASPARPPRTRPAGRARRSDRRLGSARSPPGAGPRGCSSDGAGTS